MNKELHNHNHEESCSCGHDHSHEYEESCSCGHNHSHEHEESCSCGHDHSHEHEESCSCGHDHSSVHSSTSRTVTYKINGLDCAHCAAKLEKTLSKIDGVIEANITFATKQLRITAENPDALFNTVISVAKKAEPDVVIEKIETDKYRTVTYNISGLDCAHCAAKLEKALSKIDGVIEANITFATGKLRITAENPDLLFDTVISVAKKAEPDAVIEKIETDKYRTVTYKVSGLDCAHCAAKLEKGIAEMDEVIDANLTFATGQLRITATNPDSIFPAVLERAAKLEPNAVIEKIETTSKKAIPVKKGEHKNELIKLILGGILFIVGNIINHFISGPISLIAFVPAYLLLGLDVLKSASKSLIRGHMLDENFLMSIATLGAFAINEYPEAVGVMLFFMIGEYFEHRAVEGSRKAIMETIDMRPETVQLVNPDNSVITVPAENANIGDTLLVRPGDRIPLDGIVKEGSSRIDTSPVTGEPVPVFVEKDDKLISGCVNGEGTIYMTVEKPLSESMVSRILNAVENAAAGKPQMERFITRFSRVYTPFVVLAAILVALVPPLFLSGDWGYWIHTALSFLVISCPCALVLSVPLAYFSGIGKGSASGILFKGGVSLEALNKVKVAVFDKTGTITKGDFVVQNIYHTNEINENELISLCAGTEISSTHPVASSIVKYAKSNGIELSHCENIKEISGHGVISTYNGKQILCGNEKLMKQYNVSIENVSVPEIGTHVYVAKDGKLLGVVTVGDTIKENAAETLKKLNNMGIQTVILTGDRKENAEAVGKIVGASRVYSELLPEDKLNICTDLRAEIGPVMFVGDGINDAPVLAGVDVGCAMGSGADAAIEAADVVFMKNDPNAVSLSLKLASVVNKIAKQNVIFALAIKALVMVLGLVGYANMWLAVFADSGVAMICVFNSIRILINKK